MAGLPTGLYANVTIGCNPDGTGFLRVDSIGSGLFETVQVQFSTDEDIFTAYFPPDRTPRTFSPVPVNVDYTVICIGSAAGAGTVSINGGTASQAATYRLNCFQCDLNITGVATTFATDLTANGTATIESSGGQGQAEYSIDGFNWQYSNVFTGLRTGFYQCFARYILYPSCVANGEFEIADTPIYGCTNPLAANYNPDATEDNGTCVFIPRYYPTGGSLPNSVLFEKHFNPFLRPVPGHFAPLKVRHYVTVNLYRPGENVPFATKYGRVRNGEASIDVSRELQIGMLNLTIGRGVVSQDNYAMFPFEFGYIESYNGIDEPEVRETQVKRFAIRAATQNLYENLENHLVAIGQDQPAKFMTAFETPVKFHDAPLTLAILIDESITTVGINLRLQRSYFDMQNRMVQRNSTPVLETGYVRFEINDDVVPCAAYMEVLLTDNTEEAAEMEGECFEPTTPITPPPVGGIGEVTIKDGAGNVLAIVPAGGVFVIESGFSFGFRIL